MLWRHVIPVARRLARPAPVPLALLADLETMKQNYPMFVWAAVFIMSVTFSPVRAAAPAASHPNVLLLIADDQRPDTIHALGNSVIDTPNLDRLVTEGSSFTRAIAAIPHCMPSRAEIMT